MNTIQNMNQKEMFSYLNNLGEKNGRRESVVSSRGAWGYFELRDIIQTGQIIELVYHFAKLGIKVAGSDEIVFEYNRFNAIGLQTIEFMSSTLYEDNINLKFEKLEANCKEIETIINKLTRSIELQNFLDSILKFTESPLYNIAQIQKEGTT